MVWRYLRGLVGGDGATPAAAARVETDDEWNAVPAPGDGLVFHESLLTTPIPAHAQVNRAMLLLDREAQLTALSRDQRVERMRGRRAAAVLVEATPDDEAEALPLRLIKRPRDVQEDHFVDLGRSLAWRPEQRDRLLRSLGGHLGSAAAKRANPAATSDAHAGVGQVGQRDGRTEFCKALKSASGNFVFSQILHHDQFADRALDDAASRSALSDALAEWFDFFGRGCEGPRDGTLLSFLITRWPGRETGQSRRTECEHIREALNGAVSKAAATGAVVIRLAPLADIRRNEYFTWAGTIRAAPVGREIAQTLTRAESDIFPGAADRASWVKIRTRLHDLCEVRPQTEGFTPRV